MLLLDLVDEQDLGAGFPERVEEDAGGDGHEEEYIEDYEHDEDCVGPDGLLDGHQLIVGVGVVRGQHVEHEECFAQTDVVVGISVVFHVLRDVDDLVGYDGEKDDNDRIEGQEHDDVLVPAEDCL